MCTKIWTGSHLIYNIYSRRYILLISNFLALEKRNYSFTSSIKILLYSITQKKPGKRFIDWETVATRFIVLYHLTNPSNTIVQAVVCNVHRGDWNTGCSVGMQVEIDCIVCGQFRSVYTSGEEVSSWRWTRYSDRAPTSWEFQSALLRIWQTTFAFWQLS